LRRSENLVEGRGFDDVTVEGSLIVVAKQRFCGWREDRVSKSAEATKRLAGGLMAAMVVYVRSSECMDSGCCLSGYLLRLARMID
jgi:hypothetical protein